MRFLKLNDCLRFASDAGVTEAELAAAAQESAEIPAIRVDIEDNRHRAFFLATQLVGLFQEFEYGLMWVTDFGIWPSSENQHLYYRLRRALGDSEKLNTHPGHLFAANEQDDFITFVHLAIEFGWGANILIKPPYKWVHTSHDGWLRIISAPGDKNLAEVVKAWSVPFQIEKAKANKRTRLQ